MSDNQPNVQTSVQEVDLDLDSLFSGAPGADSIVVPSSEEKKEEKPTVFTKKETDLKFLDNEDLEKKEKEAAPLTKEELEEEVKSIVDVDIKTLEEEEGTKSKAGRPKTDKSGLVEFLKKRIEANEMFAFDDYDETKQSLDEYLASLGEKDVEELWQANIDNLKQEVASKTPEQFFASLPEELQYAAKYVADGGQDLKGLFMALAQVEAVREMDPADANDQENIVRSYLQARGESQEEIEDQVQEWKQIGSLEKKAAQFKPKLDAMQEEMIQAQLQEQEYRRQQQEEAAQAYMQNVFEALRPAEINGIKLDKKVQAGLYSGLVQPQYPSISGKPTNLLGHLLEKYQFVEPNYPLIAEALWLLSDPDGYRNELKKQGKNAAVEQTVRQLKTEQSRKTANTYHEEEEYRPKKITKPQNIFKR